RRATRPEKWVDVLSTSQPTWPQRLRQRSSTGDFDVIFDSVGGDQARSLMRLLRPGGVLVHFGLLSGRPIPAECFDRSEGRRVEMFRLRDIVHACPRAQLPALFEPVLGHLRNGLLHTRIAQEVGLGALPTVLRRDKDLGRGNLLVTYDRCTAGGRRGSSPAAWLGTEHASAGRLCRLPRACTQMRCELRTAWKAPVVVRRPETDWLMPTKGYSGPDSMCPMISVMPAFIFDANACPFPRSSVHTELIRPYSVSLARRRASSSSLAR